MVWDPRFVSLALGHPNNGSSSETFGRAGHSPRVTLTEGLHLAQETTAQGVSDSVRRVPLADCGIETRFDIPFVAELARREKQIQQSYRPVIGIHKWFARRPGTVFRARALSERTGDELPR